MNKDHNIHFSIKCKTFSKLIFIAKETLIFSSNIRFAVNKHIFPVYVMHTVHTCSDALAGYS